MEMDCCQSSQNCFQKENSNLKKFGKVVLIIDSFQGILFLLKKCGGKILNLDWIEPNELKTEMHFLYPCRVHYGDSKGENP